MTFLDLIQFNQKRMDYKMSIQHNRKLNNGGFSLIEVLVAVIILSIVSLPLLTAFILSTRLNTKARTTQQVTAAAENVIEEFKNTNMMNQIWKYLGDANCTVANEDGTAVSDTIEGRKKTLKFSRNNMEFDGKFYDVVVLAKPQSLMASDPDPSITLSRTLSKPVLMDAARDDVMTLSLEKDDHAFNAFKSEALNMINNNSHNYDALGNRYHIYTDDELLMSKIEITRNIAIRIKDNPTNREERLVKGELKYEGKFVNYPVFDVKDGVVYYLNDNFTDIVESDALGPEKTYKAKEFDYKHDNEFFANVYLFYYPGYATGRIRIKNDKIDIYYDTASNYNINVHLYKQIDTLNTGLYTLEASYRPQITKHESVGILDGRYIRKINLYHNYGINLANTSEDPLSYSEASADLVEQYPIAMIHELTVTVYDHDDALHTTPLYTMKGSMSSYN